MAIFGDYESVEPLSHGSFATVLTARPVGTTRGPEFVIKHLRVESATQADGTTRSLGDFLRAADLQKQLAAESPHWAPIHDTGTTVAGPWYVSDLYSRSAQRLAKGRVRLSAGDLHHIALSTLKGLQDVRRILGRGHGNLKPANVLMTGTGPVTKSSISLTDLAPNGTESTDLRALGDLIYRLVRFDDLRTRIWPVLPSAEWTRLGEDGERWRDLCASLLVASPDSADEIEKIEIKLQELAVEQQASSKNWVYASLVVAAMVVIAIVLITWMKSR